MTGTRISPRMMLFTLYGDYIYHRGGEIWVGSLIRLIQSFGIGEQSVRSELMRMCRKGYLIVRRLGKRSYYSLSDRGKEIIEAGARRIFNRNRGPWNGRWVVITYSVPEQQRQMRDRLRQDLAWLGFGSLTPGVYVSPWEHPEDFPNLLSRYRELGQIQVFNADNVGPDDDLALVARCWNLPSIHKQYGDFLREWQPRLDRFLSNNGSSLSDEQCFVERYLLAHDYERFPLLDPGLPAELLPADWQGDRAAQVFQTYHEALQARAMRFFQSLYEGWPEAE